MDQMLLEEIQTIKTLLWINLIVLVAFIIYFWSQNILGNLHRVEAIKREQFQAKAQSLEDQGKYEKLIEKSQSRLEKYPKDIFAWWYLGISQYKSGQLGSALSTFSELNSIDPAWNKDNVNKYIEEIRSSMKGPNNANT